MPNPPSSASSDVAARTPRNLVWGKVTASRRATVMLVSTRRLGALPSSGIAQRAHEVVVDLRAGRWDDESAVALVERLGGERLHAQPRALGAHFDLAGPE